MSYSEHVEYIVAVVVTVGSVSERCNTVMRIEGEAKRVQRENAYKLLVARDNYCSLMSTRL